MKSVQWDGQRISKPGLYAGIPLPDYHRGDICDGPSISSSGLRTIWSSSPKHFWCGSPLNPAREERDEGNKDLIIGRAAHHLVCGEIGFADHYIIRPETTPEGKPWHGNLTYCKKWVVDAKRSGKAVLTPEMVETMRGMAVSLGEHPLMREGILNGLVERSMFWRDSKTGVWLKARPDVVSTSSGDFADLKTTQSVLYVDTQRSLGEYGYHQQGALVLEGARALEFEASSFSLVWVEKKRPHCVRVQTVIEEDLLRGAKQNRVCVDTFHECFINKHWPGPGDDRADAEYVQLSDNTRKRIDDRLAYQLKEAA